MALGPSTALGHVLALFQDGIRELLSKQSIVGVSPDELMAFQENYRILAFTCRFGGCRRSTVGFENKEQREQHEALHLPRFVKCEFVGCQHPAFPTHDKLQRHIMSHHREYLPRRAIRNNSTSRVEGASSPFEQMQSMARHVQATDRFTDGTSTTFVKAYADPDPDPDPARYGLLPNSVDTGHGSTLQVEEGNPRNTLFAPPDVPVSLRTLLEIEDLETFLFQGPSLIPGGSEMSSDHYSSPCSRKALL